MKTQNHPVSRAVLALFCIIFLSVHLPGKTHPAETLSGRAYPYRGNIAALRELDALSVRVYVITFGQAAHYAPDEQHLLPGKLRTSSQKYLQQQAEHALDEAGILAYGPNDIPYGGYNRQHSVPNTAPPVSPRIPPAASLAINVDVAAVPGDVHLYAVNVQTELRQLVVLRRDPAVRLTARTWPKYPWRYMHIVGPKQLQKTLKDHVAYQVEAFINDYHAAALLPPADYYGPGGWPVHLPKRAEPKDYQKK